MTPERKSGMLALIIGILGFLYILIFPKSVLVVYLGTALFTPFILYGIGIMFIPKTRRRKEGLLPFRGW
ncbi:hypothetical protein KKP90_01940 [Methanothermococcus sp. SCGC AD-155-E23]|uniref:Uncharacterized protein n=1 Tax=Methanothermococcus okinawensis TaxID=155863 RepID=A0A832ZY27_9EURY|nr:hypothetical protein [Methanothermococcus sp. SCGC AD-155-E23]HIQ32004.1 hypothetical protein [Methanothermococcus okinawensis]